MEAQRGRRRRGQTPQRSPGKPFEFITFTSPEGASSAENQQRVRSQAMRDYHRRADAPKRRKNEIELDISSLLEQSSQQARDTADVEHSEAELAEPCNEEEMLPLPSLETSLSVSRVDPFFQYPIAMGHRERELYDHGKLSAPFDCCAW
jgi:hypothetical protein